MKLTGELKEKVSKLDTKEEIKQAIMDAGMELSDEELDNVDGGFTQLGANTRYKCDNCGIVDNKDIVEKDGVKVCPRCTRKLTAYKVGVGDFR